jgi:hypothetical protein
MADRMTAAERQQAARGGASESHSDVWNRIVGDLLTETQPIDTSAVKAATAAAPKAVASAPSATAPARAPELASVGARKQVTELLNYITAKVQKAGFSLSDVPLDLAHQLKRHVQDIARRGGAYADEPVLEPFIRVGRDAASTIRQGLIDSMPADLKSDFVDAMGRFERKTKLRGAIINSFRTPSSVEAFLRDVHGRSNAAAAIHLDGLEREFGVKLMPDLEAAQATEMMDKASPGEILRHHPIAAGMAIFHPATGLPIVAGVMGAPLAGKGLQAASRGIAAGTTALSGAAERAAASPSAVAAGVKILQDAAASRGKGITSESQASVTAGRRPKRVTRLF